MSIKVGGSDPSKPIEKQTIQEKKAPPWRSRTISKQQQPSAAKEVFLNNPKPPPPPIPKPIAMVPGKGGISGSEIKTAPPRPPRPTMPPRPTNQVLTEKPPPPPRPPRPTSPAAMHNSQISPEQPGSTTVEKPPRPPRPPRSSTMAEASKTQGPAIEKRPRFSTEGPLGPPPNIPLPKTPTEERVRFHKAFSMLQIAKHGRIKQAISSVFNLRAGEERTSVTQERQSIEELGGVLKKSLLLVDGSLDPEVNLSRDQNRLETYLEQPAKHVDLKGKTNINQIVDDLDQAFVEAFSNVKETEFRKQAFQVNKEVTVDDRKGLVKEFAAPNLTANTQLFNKVSVHFHNRIVQAGVREIEARRGPEKVKKAYQREFQNTLEIAHKLYKKGNYQAALAVYSSFQGGEFNTLRDLESNNSKLTELSNFFSNNNNYKTYREKESSARVPVMTYLYGDLEQMFARNVPGVSIAQEIDKRVSNFQDRLEPSKNQKTDFVKQVYSENIDADSIYDAYRDSGLRAIMVGER